MNRREVTLFGLVVAGVVLLLAGGLILGIVRSGTNPRVVYGEAKTFAQTQGLDPNRVSCASRDTDGDGYVSCTVSQTKTDGTIALLAFECAQAYSVNDGCRLQQKKVHITRER